MEMFEKMKWGYEIRKPYTYEVKDKVVIKEKVKILQDAHSPSRIKPAVRVNTKFFVEEDQLDLQTGIDVKEIVDFEINFPNYIFKENEEKEIFIKVSNNYLEKIKFKIVVYSENDVEISSNYDYLELEKDEILSIPFKIKLLKTGGFILKFYILTEIRGEIYKSKEKSEAVFVLDKDSNYDGLLTEEKLVMENLNLRLEFNKKSGILEIKDKFRNRDYLKQSPEELGPPFYIISGDVFGEEKDFKVSLEKEKENLKGIIECKFEDFEDVILQKEIIFSNSPLLQINYKFFNRSSLDYSFLNFKIKTEVRKSDVEIVVPLKEGIVKEHLIGREFPALSGDLPEEKEKYRETWSAFEDFPYTCGLIWKDAEKIEFGIQKAPYLIYNLNLKKMSKLILPPLYLYAGYGNYQTIRNYYSFLVEETKEEKIIPIVNLKTFPEIIFLQDKETSFEINFENLRGKYLKGELEIKLPEQLELENNNFKIENKFSKRILLKRKNLNLDIYKGESLFKGEVSDLKFEVPIIAVTGDNSCSLEFREKEEKSGKIIEIDNKFLKFSVSGEFYGTIFSLKKENTEYLISSYPNPVEFSWFTPWCGGVSPLCLKDLSFPAKIPLEKYEISPVKRMDKYGNEYRGVKLSSVLSSSEFRGVLQEIEYLTLPGSNILFILSSLSNNTNFYICGFAGFGIFLTPSEESVLYFLRGDKIFLRKRSIYDAWSGSEKWSCVKIADKKFFVLVSDEKSKIIAADLGIMGHHLFAGSEVKLNRGEKMSNLYFLILTENFSSAISYRELSRIENLF
jgi:hypothetical protein